MIKFIVVFLQTERNGVFYYQSEKCYISVIICTEIGLVVASISD